MDNKDAGERLKDVSEKRGEELVQELTDEIASLHRELAALKSEVAALTDFRSSRGLVLEPPTAMVPPSLPQSVTIEADHMLRPHDGFYGVEHTSDGTPFRWTGPSVQFCFTVYVDRSNGADLRLFALTSIDLTDAAVLRSSGRKRSIISLAETRSTWAPMLMAATIASS